MRLAADGLTYISDCIQCAFISACSLYDLYSQKEQNCGHTADIRIYSTTKPPGPYDSVHAARFGYTDLYDPNTSNREAYMSIVPQF